MMNEELISHHSSFIIHHSSFNRPSHCHRACDELVCKTPDRAAGRSTMICAQCGAENREGSNYCRYCSAPLTQPSRDPVSGYIPSVPPPPAPGANPESYYPPPDRKSKKDQPPAPPFRPLCPNQAAIRSPAIFRLFLRRLRLAQTPSLTIHPRAIKRRRNHQLLGQSSRR